MKVVLLHPPQMVSLSNYTSTVIIPPLGLGYISGVLQEDGHEVTVIDAVLNGFDQLTSFGPVYVRGLTAQEISDRIPRDADAIGISCMFSCTWPYIKELGIHLKKEFPHVPLILGGEHISALPELSLEQAPFDFGVLGEGEETVAELMKVLQGELRPEGVSGIVYRDNGAIHQTPPRTRIGKIDDIPLPAWDLFDIPRYMEINQPHGYIRGRSMPMLMTRGCPYQCTFCSSPQMWTTKWLARDPHKVLDEMELYIEKYGANDFQFEDLTAVVKRQWIFDFCTELDRRQLNISWQLPSGTRSEAIDFEIATLMKKTGCHQFAYAIESGSEEILIAIKKKVNLRRAYASAREAMKAGLKVEMYFILGFPPERFRQVLQTYKAIIKCALGGFSEININAFSPLPNTEAFHQLQETKGIDLDDDYFISLFTFADLRRYKSYNPRFSDRTLKLLIYAGYALYFGIFYLVRPWKLVQILYSLTTPNPEGKLGKIIRGTVKNLLSVVRSRRRLMFKADN